MTSKEANRLMGAAVLAALSMASGAAVADDPAPPPKPPMVGGPCSYATQPGRMVVTRVDRPPGAAAVAHFEFRPKGQDHSDGAALETTFTSKSPSPGRSFRGQRQTETDGTCTPVLYTATIAGKLVWLTMTARPR
jgi:hypothetical protein